MTERIFYVKPSITQREIEAAGFAALDGWGSNSNLYIDKFEKIFAEVIGVPFAIATSSCAGALELGLAALGIGPGDEVILPAWSWISCFTAVVRVGAMPVLAEIDETFCLAPGELTRLTTPKTKAVMIIHFQGVAADMEKLSAEAHSNGIKVLEDCAEAVGATYKGKSVGSYSDIAIFSFQAPAFFQIPGP